MTLINDLIPIIIIIIIYLAIVDLDEKSLNFFKSVFFHLVYVIILDEPLSTLNLHIILERFRFFKNLN